ncbi:hypothetical protein MMC07_006792 [Pseudocyphellaria aurata]|nr:hypothetical protein [Pseudocyphellaria aurata]
MLWDKIDGTTLCPDPVTQLNDHRHRKFDSTQARVWIFTTCEQAQQSHLRGTETVLSAHKAEQDKSVDKFAVRTKRYPAFCREINESEAPANFGIAISLMSAIDEDTYRMAIFHPEGESNLTMELALESLKSAEQSLRDKEEINKLDTAQKARDRDDKRSIHCQRLDHIY